MNTEKKAELIVCASLPSMEIGVLFSKIYEVFKKTKIDFIFWGWNRIHEENKKNYPIKYLWKGGGFSSKKLVFHYLIWIFMVFINSFKISKRDVVIALSLDTALPIYFVSLIKGYSYIFINQDNFSLTYNLKGFLKTFIDYLEAKTAKRALYHILPINSRFNHKHSNILIFPNVPLESELKKSLEIFRSGKLDSFDLNTIKNDDRFKIYINGRISYHRGSEWLAKVFAALDPDKFLIISAGDIYCKNLTTVLGQLNNVIKFPRMENHKALSLYHYADILLAFYDPILPINRKAAPNKWWDCVATELPFISNSEIETLELFTKKNACFTVPYGNTEKLLNLINDLSSNHNKIYEVKNNLKKIELKSWDEGLKKMIMTIQERLSNN